MKVIEVRVDATVRKAEFESEKVGVTAIVEETDDYRSVIQELKDFIYGKKQIKKEESKASIVKENVKKTVEKETKVEQNLNQDLGNAALKEEVVSPKKERKVKEKFETYDRSNQIHKKLLSGILDEKYPKWENDTSKASAASRMLVGENFIDKEGNVLQEFIDKLVKLMDV